MTMKARHCARDKTRLAAARQSRSVHDIAGRRVRRRRMASSCRSTTISKSLNWFDRTRRTASCSSHRSAVYQSEKNTKPPRRLFYASTSDGSSTSRTRQNAKSDFCTLHLWRAHQTRLSTPRPVALIARDVECQFCSGHVGRRVVAKVQDGWTRRQLMVDVAVMLMLRFGVDEALIGDLTEQAERRSTVWLWRQAVFAIGQTVIAVAIENAARTAATAIISTGALTLWFAGTLWLYRWETATCVVQLQPCFARPRLLFFAWHIYCAPLHIAWSLGCAVVGLLVARVNRSHAAAIVLLCAVGCLPVIVRFGWPYVIAVVRPTWLHWYYVGYVTDVLITLIVLPLCMVGAGLYGARHERT